MQFGSPYSVHGRDRLNKREMLAQLGTAPEKSRMAARNTLDYTLPDGERRIRLHGTDVVTLHSHGGFTLDTGGWNTMTTRDRMNGWIPTGYMVFTHKGQIHLCTRDGTWPFLQSIYVGPRGAVYPDQGPDDNKRLRRLIDRYCREFKKRGLPTAEESKGDPWVVPGLTSESVMMDWLESCYIHRTMYALALRNAGLTDQGVAFFIYDVDRKGGNLDGTDMRRIRRYIRACVGLAV